MVDIQTDDKDDLTEDVIREKLKKARALTRLAVKSGSELNPHSLVLRPLVPIMIWAPMLEGNMNLKLEPSENRLPPTIKRSRKTPISAR